MVYGAAQRDLGALLLGIPIDWDIGHTSGLGLPRIDEWMDERHGALHSLKIDLRFEHHLIRVREQGTRRTTLGNPYGFLITPFGLTHASVTFQSNILLQRLLLLFFDALITYNRTHGGHLRQLGETQCIVDTIMTSQWRHMVRAREDTGLGMV